MGYIAAAAIIGGAFFGSRGAKKQAKAERAAAAAAKAAEEKLYSRWSGELDTLIKDKNEKLFNLGNIFERFQSTGAFGTDTRTEKNLRKAQADFAALAAGDFSAFESQLRKNMSDALITTVGSGAPVGTYAQLGADIQMGMRGAGIQTATGLSDFFANQAQNLLNMEFGIMDQSFETGYTLDRNRTTGVTQQDQRIAATKGASDMALGSFLTTAGTAYAGATGYLASAAAINQGQQTRGGLLQSMSSIPESSWLPLPASNSRSAFTPTSSLDTFTPVTRSSGSSSRSYMEPDLPIGFPDGVEIDAGVLPALTPTTSYYRGFNASPSFSVLNSIGASVARA
jgi:hypothetical protein